MAGANVSPRQGFMGGSVLARAQDAAMRANAAGERFNMRDIRTNALLSDAEWQQFDATLYRVAEERLRIVEDLRGAGLTFSLDGLGVLEVEHERLDKFTPAEQSMHGVNRTEYDLPDKDTVFTPIPITHKDFQLEFRPVLSSRRRGVALDTVSLELATRQVVEKLEEMVVSGGDITLAGNPIHGITTHPDRNTHTISATWDTVTNTDAITADVLTMISVAEGDNYFGPFMLYIPKNYSTVMEEDYDTSTTTLSRTVRDRLLQIDQLSGIRVLDALADDNVVMIQLTRDVIDLPVAQELTTVDWDSQGGFVTNFKVFAALSCRVKSTKLGQSGIVHGS